MHFRRTERGCISKWLTLQGCRFRPQKVGSSLGDALGLTFTRNSCPSIPSVGGCWSPLVPFPLSGCPWRVWVISFRNTSHLHSLSPSQNSLPLRAQFLGDIHSQPTRRPGPLSTSSWAHLSSGLCSPAARDQTPQCCSRKTRPDQLWKAQRERIDDVFRE